MLPSFDPTCFSSADDTTKATPARRGGSKEFRAFGRSASRAVTCDGGTSGGTTANGRRRSYNSAAGASHAPAGRNITLTRRTFLLAVCLTAVLATTALAAPA